MSILASQVIQVVVDSGGPSVTDWLGVGVGFLAAVAAGGVVLPAWRQLRMLVSDRTRELNDHERSQASKFSVWTQYSKRQKEMQVLYANGNDGPVYDVRGEIYLGDERIINFELGTVGPTDGSEIDDTLGRLLRGRIDATLRNEFGEDVDRKNGDGTPNRPVPVILRLAELDESVHLKVSFRDSSGVGWTRENDGQLVRVDESQVTESTALPRQSSERIDR